MENIQNAIGGGVYSHKKKRVGWIDIAKGIAILLLVYKHTVTDIWDSALKFEKILIGLIDGFRMPLMFMLSAMTCRYSTDLKAFKQNTIKAMKHLLLPALGIFVFYFVYNICKTPANLTSWQYWKEQFFVLIYYAGVDSPMAAGIGASWFFVALFATRVLFDILQLTLSKKLLVIIVCVLCCVGVTLGQNEILVFSFDVALVVLPFTYAGYWWKTSKRLQLSIKQKIFGGIALSIFWSIFTLASYQESFNFAFRRYPFFPLCIFVELAGCILVIELSKLLEKAKIFYPLQFLGKYCIYFYIAHCIDSTWKVWYQITNNTFGVFCIRTAINLAIFLVFVGIHIGIKKIMQIKNKKKSKAM